MRWHCAVRGGPTDWDAGRWNSLPTRFGAFLKQEGLIDQVPAFDTYNVVPE